MTATARERFCAVLGSTPLLRGDAIVVLEGDGTTRLPAAVQLLRTGAAPFIVVSGGLDKPPHCITAEKMAGLLMGMGVGPDRILLDSESKNTQEQARHVFRLAEQENWSRLLIVASPYHAPRAFLTFLKELQRIDKDRAVHVVMVPASQAPWFAKPDGLEVTRFDLLDDEFRKVDVYGEQGHVASWDDGIEYLRYWEGR